MKTHAILAGLLLACLPAPALADIVVLNNGPGNVTDFHMLVLRPGLGPPASVPWGAGTSGDDLSWNWSGTPIAQGGKLRIKDLVFVDTDQLGNNVIIEAWWTRDGVRVDNEVTYGTVPEPTSWALMILGFGAIGVAARRRTLSPG
jgi:hypothetical protein